MVDIWSIIVPKPTIDITNIPIGEKSIPNITDIKFNILGKKDKIIKKIPINIQINE